MPHRVIRVRSSAADLVRQRIAKLQQELGISPDFPAAVERAAAAARPELPDLDRTDLPFVTIDPASSRDLDQAMHLARDSDGYLVHYAIADVAAFVPAGGPVDLEARRRGETLYGADSKIPLHPTVLSEGAASLLPDQVCPALLWTMRLDSEGALVQTHVERARVRSVAKLSYEEVQRAIVRGETRHALLREIGQKRMAQEAARGGVSLPMPEQEIVIEGSDWHLEFRHMLDVENWNAQLSLLTGIAAAQLMLAAKVGILRTLPPAEERAVKRLRRSAAALGVPWPAELSYPEFVRSLDPAKPAHAAMTVACTTLLRGAGYVTFDGDLPAQTEHSALATPYAHVTAPLRRLIDRFAGEICVAVCAGEPPPAWVREALPDLPATMAESSRRANRYENAVVDLIEAEILSDDVGGSFAGVILEAEPDAPTKGVVQIIDPATEAAVTSAEPLPVGEKVNVTLTVADPDQHKVAFRL